MPNQTAVRPSFSGTALKRIATLCMLLDHIGASCLECGIMALWPNPTGCTTFAQLAAADPAFAPLYQADQLLRMIGRLAFPLYCFLLAEGFAHTRSVQRYGLRLALFALVSELPFNLAFFNGLWAPQHQNVYFTLFLGLCAMAWLRRYADHTDIRSNLLRVAGVAACAGLAVLLRTDYDAMGVVLIAVFWQFRAQPMQRSVLAGLLTCQTPTALLALPLTHGYNGQRGRCHRWEAWAFYWFYPLHLLLLSRITAWLRTR